METVTTMLKQPYMVVLFASLAFLLALICINKSEAFRFKEVCMDDSTDACRCNKVIYNLGGVTDTSSSEWSKYVISCMSNFPTTKVSDEELWKITKDSA